MYIELFCWKCAEGNIQSTKKTSQTVLVEEHRGNGTVLIRAVCTICGTGNIIIRKESKSENT